MTETEHAFHSVIVSFFMHLLFWLLQCDNDISEVLCDASTRGCEGALCVFREDVCMPATICSRQLQP